MDAPTAYIFPEIYDKVTVIKGPQTVLYPGHGSAATVRFERDQKVYDKPGYDVYASGLVGSFGRHDELIDANVGNKDYFASFTGSNTHSQDYKDGSGNRVHSQYSRYSASSTFGLTPDNNKRFEVSASRSDGYAAYADRTMDGTKFLRENVAGRGQIKNISDLVEKLEFQVSRNTIFHTMSESMRGGTAYMDVTHDTNALRTTARLLPSRGQLTPDVLGRRLFLVLECPQEVVVLHLHSATLRLVTLGAGSSCLSSGNSTSASLSAASRRPWQTSRMRS